jgi:hypothetical protein
MQSLQTCKIILPRNYEVLALQHFDLRNDILKVSYHIPYCFHFNLRNLGT